MTLDDFNFWTNNKIKLDAEQFDIIVAVASGRLASFLCLENLPDPLNDDLKLVLAQFIKLLLDDASDSGEKVASKSVRNFTIQFTNNTANIFAKIAKNYGDILNRYSDCGYAFKVEKTADIFNENGCLKDDYKVGYNSGWDIISHDGRI